MIKRILCATDGSGHAERAVHQAAEMAAKFNADLFLLVVNVMHGGRGPLLPQLRDEEVEEILKNAAAIAARAGFPDPRTAVVQARDPAPAIVEYAAANGCDHIVTGTGDKHGLTRLVLGSVASDVVRMANCSVTVAR